MDEVGANFSKEFVFVDVGNIGVTMESMLETQATCSTTFNFKAVENTTIKGHVALNKNKHLWLPYHQNSVLWAFFHLNDCAMSMDVKNPK